MEEEHLVGHYAGVQRAARRRRKAERTPLFRGPQAADHQPGGGREPIVINTLRVTLLVLLLTRGASGFATRLLARRAHPSPFVSRHLAVRPLVCSVAAAGAEEPLQPQPAPSEWPRERYIDELAVSSEWKERLRELTRPSAVALIRKLHEDRVSPLCYRLPGDKKEGAPTRKPATLVDWVSEAKREHPDKLLLVRVGDFYEAFGLDAAMLVQHAGLNPMGGNARAGCPIPNVQPTLNDLTAAGLTVAVYEEVGVKGADPAYKGLKKRALSQVVSPASPTYLFNLALSPDEIAYEPPPPYVAVGGSAAGYTLVQVDVDERAYRVHRRLSRAALRALLAARPHAPPLLVDTQRVPAHLPFLPKQRAALRSPADVPASADAFVAVALREIAARSELEPDSFRQLPARDASDLDAPPRPLYVSTAAQIGLLGASGVPDLPAALLPPAAPAASVALLRRWLLVPPRPSVADRARTACAELAALSHPMPSCRPLPPGKLVGVLAARQANVPFFDELRLSVRTLQAALAAKPLAALNDATLALVREESGVALPPETLGDATAAVLAAIDAVLVHSSSAASASSASSSAANPPAAGTPAGASASAELDEVSRDPHEPPLVPEAFFERNERFRGLVQRRHAADAYGELEAAALELCAAVHSDLPPNHSLVHDIFNNALYFKDDTTAAAKAKRKKQEQQQEQQQKDGATPPAALEVARDRNRRQLPSRFTSARVRTATERYWAACEAVEEGVRAELRSLCDQMAEHHLPTLLTAAHWSLVSSTLAQHVGCALSKGWALPSLRAADDADRGVRLHGVWPYWLPKEEAVANELDWQGLWVLTAPNMAGKSSLMRATTVAALLTNAGLYAPAAAGGAVPRYDAYFVRTSAFDVPAEGMSSFAQEMDDLQVMTSECGARSLVMLDEIGRGTSTHEGAALAVALLEWMEERSVGAMFATHLHEIRPLLEPSGGSSPSVLPSLAWRRLQVVPEADGAVRMTYQIEEGVCLYSHALHTARAAGLPASLLRRAASLIDETRPDASWAGHEPAAAAERVHSDGMEGGGHEGGEAAEDTMPPLLRSASETLQDVRASASGAPTGPPSLVHVPPHHAPPPRLCGRSVVYVLQIDGRGAAPSCDLYVGESDAIGRRLEEHRRRFGAAGVHCVLLEVESKSDATALEERAIRQLQRRGLARLLNVAGQGAQRSR